MNNDNHLLHIGVRRSGRSGHQRAQRQHRGGGPDDSYECGFINFEIWHMRFGAEIPLYSQMVNISDSLYGVGLLTQKHVLSL